MQHCQKPNEYNSSVSFKRLQRQIRPVFRSPLVPRKRHNRYAGRVWRPSVTPRLLNTRQRCHMLRFVCFCYWNLATPCKTSVAYFRDTCTNIYIYIYTQSCWCNLKLWAKMLLNFLGFLSTSSRYSPIKLLNKYDYNSLINF